MINNRSRNSKLLDPLTGHFAVLDFINVKLNISLLWHAIDIEENEKFIGTLFNGFDVDTNKFVGSIRIYQSTIEHQEKVFDITQMSKNEIKNYNEQMHMHYKEFFGDKFISLEDYEIFVTQQNISAYVTKPISKSEDDHSKFFNRNMKINFHNKEIYIEISVSDNNLNFMKYLKKFREISEKIFFEYYFYKYVGDFKNNLYHGKGTLSVNNDTYSGNFKEGSFHGQGTLSINDKQIYSGKFQNGFAIESLINENSIIEEIQRFFRFSFSFYGRASDVDYLKMFFLVWLAFPFLVITLFEIFIYCFPSLRSYQGFIQNVFFLNSPIVLFWLHPLMIPIIIKRLNDLNMKKYHIWFLFIPGIRFFYPFGRTKSNIPINKYGFSKKIIFPNIVINNSPKGPWEK